MLKTLFNALLGGIAQRIEAAAKGMFGRLLGLLRAKKNAPTKKEVVQVLSRFDQEYAEELAKGMSQVSGERVTAQQVQTYLIGDVALSDRLYHQSQQTANRVQRILKDHVKYAHDARKLALDLFEGYGFKDEDVLNPKVRLPKYLNDALLNRDMDALLARIKRASKLKTAPLRAGYLQLLDKILKTQGQAAIERAMETAVYERYRYFANRIAQTELARTQMDQHARELMADESLEVVQYCLSQTHPKPDICDLYAHQNAYGLGPGLYPKARAPKPPAHPFCRCHWRPRLDLSAAGAQENPQAAADHLKSLDSRAAARVAGSRAKRDEVLNGTHFDDVVNAGRPAAYKVGRLGDVIEGILGEKSK